MNIVAMLVEKDGGGVRMGKWRVESGGSREMTNDYTIKLGQSHTM